MSKVEGIFEVNNLLLVGELRRCIFLRCYVYLVHGQITDSVPIGQEYFSLFEFSPHNIAGAIKRRIRCIEYLVFDATTDFFLFRKFVE